MIVEEVITCANRSVELQFRVMERSLRATGSKIPLRVIPYDDDRFDLPPNAEWLIDESIQRQIRRFSSNGMHRRYSILLRGGYQLIDCDVVFLQNPESALSRATGFVATCTQWLLPQFALTPQTVAAFDSVSTTWRGRLFNAGQFACDRALYERDELLAVLARQDWREVLYNPPTKCDQPGFNLLVAWKKPPFVNLTLPPFVMESTWAGDYPGEFKKYWVEPDRQPYLMHWAGAILGKDRAIDQLFYDYLTFREFAEWRVLQAKRAEASRRAYLKSLTSFQRSTHFVKMAVRQSLGYAGIHVPDGWLRQKLSFEKP